MTKEAQAKLKKEVTIAGVCGFVVWLVNFFAIPVPSRTFYFLAVGGALAGSALGGIVRDSTNYLKTAIFLGVIFFVGAVYIYVSRVQIGSADLPSIGILMVAFAVIFLSFVFLLRMARIDSWAYPNEDS